MGEQAGERKLLLISDVRGCALLPDGGMDKMSDLKLSWQSIERLQPVKSLVKFDAPNPKAQFFEYAPGVLLKQVFCYYGTCEVRLMIDGVPPRFRRYNTWEYYKKMKHHHEHVRGQIFKAGENQRCLSCFDSCFDCSVLWSTVSMYAAQNSMNPHPLLEEIVKNHMYTPSGSWDTDIEGWENRSWVPPALSERWQDVEYFLSDGRLMEAIAALEAAGSVDEENTNWSDIGNADSVVKCQPCLAKRLRGACKQQISRSQMIQLIGSLSEPFTLVRTDLNGLFMN